MKKPFKILLIVGIVFTFIGGVVTAVGYGHFKDFPVLYWGEDEKIIQSPGKVRTTSEEFTVNAFSNIEISSEIGTVEIKVGDGYSLQYWNYPKDSLPSWNVKNETLSLQYESDQKGLVMFGVNVDVSPRITVTVPRGSSFSAVTVSADENVSLSGIVAETLDVYSDYGDEVYLQNVEAASAEIHAGNSSLRLDECVLGKCNLQTEYGDMKITGCRGTERWKVDAKNGDIGIKDTEFTLVDFEVEYGDAAMENITSQGMALSMENGSAQMSGNLRGNTEIGLLYGDLDIKLLGNAADYGYCIAAEYGNITVDGKTVEGAMVSKNDTPDQINVESENGDVKLSFRQTDSQ